MANMGYCRFQNTYKDLRDCQEHIYESNVDTLSPHEKKYRAQLIDLCRAIAADFPEEFDEDFHDADEN